MITYAGDNFAIGQRAITVTADAGQSKVYGNADPASFTYTNTSLGTGTALVGSLTRNAGEPVGNYAITQGGITNAANTNYVITYAGDNFAINTRAITVSGDNKSRVYGDANPTLTYTVATGTSSGLVNGDSLSGAVATTADGTSNVGNYAINQGTLAATSNYALTYTNGNLAINPAILSLLGMRDYDMTTAFAAAIFGTAGTIAGINGQTLVLSGAGSVALPTAGTRALNASGLALGNGTGLASNYTLAGGTHKGTIVPTVNFSFGWIGSGGSWNNPANWSQGAVPLDGATVTIPSLSSPIVYSGGVSNLMTVTSLSGLTLTGGTLNLSGTGTAASSFSGFPLTLAGGTLGGGGTLNIAMSLDVLTGGVLGGSRLIVGNVNNIGGTVAPGASPGVLTINGNYVQGPSGTLAIQLGGTAAGTQYDQLVVTGNAALGGTLAVTLLNGFVPADGSKFSVVQCGGALSGAFASSNLPVSPTFNTTYLASRVDLTAGVSGQFSSNITDYSINNSASSSSSTVLQSLSSGSGSGSLTQASSFLETSTGATLVLVPASGPQTGVYTDVATGALITLDANSTPPPGIYVSQDNSKVLVITASETGGKPVVTTASTGSSRTTIDPNAKVKRLAACN